MKTYIVGGVIKEFRIRYNISQEELCDGLCAVSTLSRIESGKQISGRNWNPPYKENPNFSESDFSEIERTNINNLLEEEKRRDK